MDLLSLIKPEELNEFSAELSKVMPTQFIGSQLFQPVKSNNFAFSFKSILEGDAVPVTAKVHAYDTEAVIGDRPNFEEIKLEKLFIKEKINSTERIEELLGSNYGKDDVIQLIFNDVANMHSAVLARCEQMRMQYLATGGVTVAENNVIKELSYGYDTSHNIALGNSTSGYWASSSADILGDLETAIETARAKGYTIKRAICSLQTIKYMQQNTAIKGYLSDIGVVPTQKNVIAWINENYGIEFIVNEDIYKTSYATTVSHRFFPQEKIAFICTDGFVGTDLFGVTPEERAAYKDYSFNEKLNVAITQWNSPDPVATWTKASALYLPVPKDKNALFIGTVEASS